MPRVIGFLCNHAKTVFFHRIAVQLQKRGHQIRWIGSGRRWTDWLVAQGVPRHHILNIADFGSEWRAPRNLTDVEIARLAAMERFAGLGVRDIILMDRILRRGDLDLAVRHLAVCAEKIDAFLAAEGIDVLFGEQTWGFELIAGKCAERRGIQVYQPAETRIPWGRCVFFRSHLFADIAEVGTITEADRQAGREIWARFVRERKKPEYFYRNAKVPRPRANWPLKLVKHLLSFDVERDDMTAFPTSYLVEWRMAQTRNVLAFKRKTPFEKPDLANAPRFVAMMLHVQPENTLDVMASRFTNQIEVVKAFARALPMTHELWVKEHAGAIGDRPISYYEELKRIPRVRLIDPWVDAFALADRADMVVSIGGTVCYETSLLGRKAMTLTPMFFSPVVQAPIVDVWSGEAFRQVEAALAAPLWPMEKVQEKAEAFLAWLHANSFAGEIGDPVSMPGCDSDENIAAVTHAFLTLLEHPGSRQVMGQAA